MSQSTNKRVSIVVVGDIGRSPRMQYHALSLLEHGFDVELVGYSGSKPLDKLLESKNCKINYIYSCPEFKNYLPTTLAYIAKVLWQIITIFIALLFSNCPDFVLVQNPPAVPALLVCYVFCKLFRCKYVIDWHNYAHTIMALSLGTGHILVKISKWFEFYFGRKADENLCVTSAMRDDLKVNHNVRATVFHDCPPSFFKETSVQERHELFKRLGKEYKILLKDCNQNDTVFTKCLPDSTIVLRDDRPALIISSTSWTEDEDFSILLSALDDYEKAKQLPNELPALVCAITGKGPLKEFYSEIIKRRNWKYVNVITLWLEPADYPVFLGSADLGVCLHKSSSGLDLPMKLVDMFGCSLPVCAVGYNCISELVRHEENGFIFNNAYELCEQMKEIFHQFPKETSELYKNFKANLHLSPGFKWNNSWDSNVKPIFSDNKSLAVSR